ncbi:hypothetical protein SDRG_09013 [Saprolegnia diclina VS20]|uniref:Uncharacterized protein n=1 Tax=Saprolegnia diclina (strain VS20) TaxID=1156394 RepID=T0Q6P9_SAPDV|nr:hypothetical protein SDRG_09013 [Saprolegnia diclina VS20]EQC33504.1 hypothetical protein SDRG_09013 [Saprolegnia diclina VS20]|eukprot:XP_008613144.1 hypothetical protein SDRG_09013 [Saprolegnia diclina VS20]
MADEEDPDAFYTLDHGASRLPGATDLVRSTRASCESAGMFDDQSLPPTPVPDDVPCRYKTGKCPYPRAIKVNKKDGSGARLLLCERHRRLQNKTKKRSDVKYKDDRAILRVVKRLTPDVPMAALKAQLLTAPTTPDPPAFSSYELDMLAYYLL